MLAARTLMDADGIAVADVACRHRRGRGEPGEHIGSHALVLVRRGAFTRVADGTGSLLDPTRGYWMRPGEEQRYDHPHDEGDDCTAFYVSPSVLASMAGGEPWLPAGTTLVSPQLDLGHRLLLAAARRGEDAHAVFERALALVAGALRPVAPARVDSGRPPTATARRALADDARLALADDPDRSLVALARDLAVSPHHLSRVFRAETGTTVSRHRMRLRARRALERLAGGEHDLARLAADTGFADQSHLCRVIRSETGTTPSALRAALA